MPRSALLDRGREYVDIYPEVTVVNDRGLPIKTPSKTPVRVRVTTTKDRSQIAELSGQIDTDIIKCFARTAPLGSWARIVMNGEEYDLAEPPRFAPGVSRASKHVEFTIRSRSGLGAPAGG